MDAEPTIILFDGLCNLCSGVVRFVIKRDPRAHFRFASLQSDVARQLCARAGHPLPTTPDPDTIIVIANGRVLERSDAAIAIARGLNAPWTLLGVARIIPRPIRDALYRLVARNRYRWFGKRDTCMVPTADLRARFID